MRLKGTEEKKREKRGTECWVESKERPVSGQR